MSSDDARGADFWPRWRKPTSILQWFNHNQSAARSTLGKASLVAIAKDVQLTEEKCKGLQNFKATLYLGFKPES